MELLKYFEILENNDDFKGWKKIHPDSFFSYALKTIDEKAEQPWQLGFFNEKTQKMVTFIVKEDSVELQPEEEVFKKPETAVKEIEQEKLSIPYEKIQEKIAEFVKATYPKELITKKIIILQNLEGFGTIWNFTMISQTFNTINVKMNAESGQVLHHSCENFLNFIKKGQQ